jgi:hypothetical protein
MRPEQNSPSNQSEDENAARNAYDDQQVAKFVISARGFRRLFVLHPRLSEFLRLG